MSDEIVCVSCPWYLLNILINKDTGSLSLYDLFTHAIFYTKEKKRIMSTHLHQSSIMDVPLLIGEGNLI